MEKVVTMQRRSKFVFFLFPLFISVGLFVNSAGTLTAMGDVERLVYWVSVWVLAWAIAFSLSQFMFQQSRFLRQRQGLSFFIAIEISVWTLRLFTPFMLALINDVTHFDPTPYANELGYYPPDSDHFLQFVYYSSFPITVWMAVNYLFIWFGIALYEQPKNTKQTSEHQPAETPSAAATWKPVFLRNNPEINPQDILVISAEDHYVNVITEEKSTLIHFRFSDCLSEMQRVEGLRIHRSHWAKKEAIEKIERQGRKTVVTIKTGLTLPVSQTYLGCLEQLH